MSNSTPREDKPNPSHAGPQGVQGVQGIQGIQGVRGEPGTPSNSLVEAIKDLAESTREGQQTNIDLITAVKKESSLRTEKIHTIEKTNTTISKLLRWLIAGLLLLVVLAGINVYNTTITSNIARDAQETNELLVGCFTPGSSCQKQSQANQLAQQAVQRQTTFVLFVCARQYPNPPNPTKAQIDASTAKLQSCVREYYPDFKLPVKKS